MMDIDNFKAVNDGFGHGTGDQVVQAVGAALLSALRETDIVWRHGGDEFVVTLPACEAEQAMAIAEGIRQAIKDRCDVSIAELAGFSVTVSIGLAVYSPETDRDLNALMHRADGALYDAKAAGRNTVVLAPLAGNPVANRSSVYNPLMRASFLRLLTAVLLVHAQAVLAFEPCGMASAAPASAFSDMPEDCGMHAVLCLAHCQIGDQSGGQPLAAVLPALDTVVLWLPYRPIDLVPSGAWHARRAQRCTGPPTLDLLCSLNL